jgi:predicted O-methyltransferase YrrM
VRNGEVANLQSDDALVKGVQKFINDASAHARLDGTAVQTVGAKGYDGFALLIVKE